MFVGLTYFWAVSELGVVLIEVGLARGSVGRFECTALTLGNAT